MSVLTWFIDEVLQANIAVSNHVIVYALLLVPLAAIVFSFQSSPRLPVINGYSWDWTRKRAKQEFVANTEGLLNEGLRRYPDQPFWLIATLGDKIILPHSYIDWVKRHPDLDHLASVGKDFFNHYPGFEGITAFAGDPDTFLVKLIKRKWTQITPALIETFDRNSDTFIQKYFGDGRDYHDVSWHKACMEMVALTTCHVFAGARFARDPKWQALVTSYPYNMFYATRVLRSWPAIIRPLIHWVLPQCRLCRGQVAEARKMIETQSLETMEFDNTALQWSQASKNLDPAIIQMGLVFGAVHTTSQLLDQCVTDIALAASSLKYPSLISDLRQEIEAALAETDGQFAPSTLSKLVLLDACIKESQRFKPQNLLSLERVAKRSIKLPCGVVVPKGTQVALATTPVQSESIWGPDAGTWNPYRFRMEENSRMKANSVNNKHYAFGVGQYACPGRFLSVAEIELMMAKIIRGWDLRVVVPNNLSEAAQEALNQGRVPVVTYGNEQLSDERFGLEARKIPN